MYKLITNGGESLGITEAPNYIRQSENGSYILCPEPEASGIAFAGNVYQLLGREPMEGSAGVVVPEEVDAGEEIHAAKLAAADADGMIVSQEYRLTMLELGLTDEM